jgi:hypothetical protein
MFLPGDAGINPFSPLVIFLLIKAYCSLPSFFQLQDITLAAQINIYENKDYLDRSFCDDSTTGMQQGYDAL